MIRPYSLIHWSQNAPNTAIDACFWTALLGQRQMAPTIDHVMVLIFDTEGTEGPSSFTMRNAFLDI